MAFLLLIAVIVGQASIEERFDRAVGLQKQGSFKEAEAEYRAILVENPNYDPNGSV